MFDEYELDDEYAYYDSIYDYATEVFYAMFNRNYDKEDERDCKTMEWLEEVIPSTQEFITSPSRECIDELYGCSTFLEDIKQLAGKLLLELNTTLTPHN